jgi:hypothetical protein
MGEYSDFMCASWLILPEERSLEFLTGLLLGAVTFRSYGLATDTERFYGSAIEMEHGAWLADAESLRDSIDNAMRKMP